MGRSETRNKAQKLAAHLAEHSPIRTTGQCPWGCGASYVVSYRGHSPLLSHLMKCRGNPRKVSKR